MQAPAHFKHASCFRDRWIRTSAGMASVLCSCRIIRMERRNLRDSTMASWTLASSDSAMVGTCPSPAAS